MAQANLKTEEFMDHQKGEQHTQYLTFSLMGEEYGVEILGVQEVKVWTPVTMLPNTPIYAKGVLNLRGDVVPIIDLRLCFGMEAVEYNDTTVIVVLKLKIDNKARVIGLVVDSVSDVLDIQNNQIKNTDEFDLMSKTDSVTGVATLDTKIVILIDAGMLFNNIKLESLTQSAEAIKRNNAAPFDNLKK